MSANTSAFAPQKGWPSDWLSVEESEDVSGYFRNSQSSIQQKFRGGDTSTVSDVYQVASELVMTAISSSRSNTSANRYFLQTLPKLVRTKLGWKAARRLKRFRMYEDGWCGGSSAKLSFGSEISFFKFLRNVPTFQSRPSIFVDRDGLLEISWEEKDGSEISIAFGDQYLEVSDGKSPEPTYHPIGRSEDIRSIRATLNF